MDGFTAIPTAAVNRSLYFSRRVKMGGHFVAYHLWAWPRWQNFFVVYARSGFANQIHVLQAARLASPHTCLLAALAVCVGP